MTKLKDLLWQFVMKKKQGLTEKQASWTDWTTFCSDMKALKTVLPQVADLLLDAEEQGKQAHKTCQLEQLESACQGMLQVVVGDIIPDEALMKLVKAWSECEDALRLEGNAESYRACGDAILKHLLVSLEHEHGQAAPASTNHGHVGKAVDTARELWEAPSLVLHWGTGTKKGRITCFMRWRSQT